MAVEIGLSGCGTVGERTFAPLYLPRVARVGSLRAAPPAQCALGGDAAVATGVA